MIDVVEDVSYGLLVSSCVRLGVVVSVFVVVVLRPVANLVVKSPRFWLCRWMTSKSLCSVGLV